MRTFVIVKNHSEVDIDKNIIAMLPADSKILVFKPENEKNEIKAECTNIQVASYPEEMKTHESKLRNFISSWLIANNTKGFVHVITDSTEIFGNTQVFLDEIEKMMTVFKLKSWFNTSCDICNYVYSKYNPRFYIAIDEDEAKAKYDKIVAWCSNANTQWICYNMDILQFDDIRFEEKFRFPMYLIIEFLARRRNEKKPGELNYMNFYPSVPEELNVFKIGHF